MLLAPPLLQVTELVGHGVSLDPFVPAPITFKTLTLQLVNISHMRPNPV